MEIRNKFTNIWRVTAYLQEHLSIQQLIVVSHKVPPVVTVQDLGLFFPLLRGWERTESFIQILAEQSSEAELLLTLDIWLSSEVGDCKSQNWNFVKFWHNAALKWKNRREVVQSVIKPLPNCNSPNMVWIKVNYFLTESSNQNLQNKNQFSAALLYCYVGAARPPSQSISPI